MTISMTRNPEKSVNSGGFSAQTNVSRVQFVADMPARSLHGKYLPPGCELRE
jgi:hypothetical protein